ncbi:class E sortase [Streptomyces sp. NPDC048389]|uniref:class E sortase n=1 Tax=Streptomyces sp. NPDC048389 TaxID=3154622 RepID=UPI0034567F2B
MSVRVLVRTFSELCLTAGTLIVLFVVHLLFWTGVEADHATDREIDRLEAGWATGQGPSPAAPGGGEGTESAPNGSGPAQNGAESAPNDSEPAPKAYAPGEPFAVMYIPRFGADWDWPVLQGTGTDVLKKGLGHYASTGPLGAKGNFAVAGHRRTHGDPFKDFPRLRPGDAVVLTDGTTWFTYRIANKPYRTVPSDVGVIDPVPRPLKEEAAAFDEPGRYLTLTTCEPEWGSSHRLVVWAHLDATHPVTDGKPPALRS